MAEIAASIGYWFMLIGGCLIAAALLGGIGWIVCQVWTEFLSTFAAIRKVEHLIYEFWIHKREFLEWKAERERGENDGRS